MPIQQSLSNQRLSICLVGEPGTRPFNLIGNSRNACALQLMRQDEKENWVNNKLRPPANQAI